MELWLRTQGKKRLLQTTYCGYDFSESEQSWYIYSYPNGKVGFYKTEERCLEIIDEIQKLLLSANGDYLVKLQDIDVNAEVKTVYVKNFIQKLQSPIMPIDNEPSVQFVQPSVLVYEMPKE